MGLGPPVCDKCMVLGRLNIATTPSCWYCPICNSSNLSLNLFTCGLTADELEANLRFLVFIKGPQGMENLNDNGHNKNDKSKSKMLNK